VTYADYLINGALWLVFSLYLLMVVLTPLVVYFIDSAKTLIAVYTIGLALFVFTIVTITYRYDVGLA
jgi:hypothetical protein